MRKFYIEKYIVYLILILLFIQHTNLNLAVKVFGDDLSNMNFYLKSNSLTEYIKEMYLKKEGSYSQFLFMVPLTSFLVRFGMENIYLIFSGLLFIIGLSIITKRYFELKMLESIAISSIFINSLVFISPGYLKDDFFWLTGNLSYILPIIIALYFLLFLMFWKKRYFQIAYVLGTIVIIIFCGFRIILNVDLAIILLILLYYVKDKNIKILLVYYLCIVALSTLLYVSSPGNFIRYSNENKHFFNLNNLMPNMDFIKTYYYCLKEISFKNGFETLPLILPAIYFLKTQNRISLTYINRLVFFYLIFLMIHCYFMFVMVGSPGPSRTLIIVFGIRNYLLILMTIFLYQLIQDRNILWQRSFNIISLSLFIYFTYNITQKVNIDIENFQLAQYRRKKEIIYYSKTGKLIFTRMPEFQFLSNEDASLAWDPRYKNKKIFLINE